MVWKYWMLHASISFQVSAIYAQSDPCINYTPFSAVSSKSDYTLKFGANPINLSQPVGWVRYTRTINGSLITDCPLGNECGVNYQYWMNDSLPAEEDGSVPKQICGRNGVKCCDVEFMINVKNCSDFVVYELKAATQGARYCFGNFSCYIPYSSHKNDIPQKFRNAENHTVHPDTKNTDWSSKRGCEKQHRGNTQAADPVTTTTSTTGTTITTMTTTNTTLSSSDESGGINITIIAAVAGGVVFLILIVIIVIVCVKKRKKRSIGNSSKEWQELNIAAIYRTKHKDLLIPRLMYQSGKPKTNASMVYLNPRDEDWIDMKEMDKIPRTRSELEIFSPPEIDRLGIDISAVYQTRAQDKLVANTKFSTQRLFGNDKFSLYSFEDYMPYYDIDKIKFH